MGRSCVVFCLIVGAAFLCVHQSKAAGDKLFGNMTYFTDCPYIAEEVTLMNGYRVVWNGRLHVSLSYGGQYVWGDFNRDGFRDAAVIIHESEGGSADWRSLAFLINDGARLVHQQSAYLGDRVIVNSLKERSGRVIIDMFVHREGDCMAGPTKRVRNVYMYHEPNRWAEVSESPYQRIYADGLRAFQEIYDTPIPAQIRQMFDRTVRVDHDACSDCAFTVLDGKTQVGIFTKKFIIVDLEPDGFGGVSATLVFEGTSNPFLLWMDDIGGGRYALRNMAELPGLLGEGFVRQLRNPAYRHHWL